MHSTTRIAILGAAAAALFFSSSASTAPTDAQSCLAAKEKALSKLELCVWKAQAKASQLGGSADTALCVSKFDEAWAKPDAKYGDDCPDATAATIRGLFDDHVAEVLAALSAAPSDCGNGTVDMSEQCDGSNVNGATCSGLGYGNMGTVSCSGTCTFNTSACQGCSVHAQDCPNGADSCSITGGGDTGCAPPGTATEGQDCSTDGCVESNVCATTDSVNFVCYQYCQVSNPTQCSAGEACAPLQDYNDIGACVPT